MEVKLQEFQIIALNLPDCFLYGAKWLRAHGDAQEHPWMLSAMPLAALGRVLWNPWSISGISLYLLRELPPHKASKPLRKL